MRDRSQYNSLFCEKWIEIQAKQYKFNPFVYNLSHGDAKNHGNQPEN